MNKQLFIAAVALLAAVGTQAKLAAPPQDDAAKAKAAEAAAKTAHGNKVAAYQLCKSIDRTAAHYAKTAKAAKSTSSKPVQPAVDTPACTDPGPFVYPPPAAGASAPAAPKAASKAAAKAADTAGKTKATPSKAPASAKKA